jgi:hypothetical protein
MHNNPQDTFNVLLSLSQTFTRFAPESELIYDDIQQFAGNNFSSRFWLVSICFDLVKLNDTIDQCFTRLDQDTIKETSQLCQTAQENLLKIIQQQSKNLIL